MNNLEIEKNQIYLAVVPKKKYNDFNGHFFESIKQNANDSKLIHMPQKQTNLHANFALQNDLIKKNLKKICKGVFRTKCIDLN